MTDTTATSSDDDRPWEPPFDGTEAQHLLGALDRLRWTFRYKADDLDASALAARFGRSTLTLGGLMKHLAVQEDHAFSVKTAGEQLPAAWASNGWDQDDDWEFSSAATDDPAYLYALYDAAVARARSGFAGAVERGGLDQQVAQAAMVGRPVSLRRVLFDLVEEYGRHTGQADLLREAVDGRVGEDPPPGWRPLGARA